jgi:hypothetical protein
MFIFRSKLVILDDRCTPHQVGQGEDALLQIPQKSSSRIAEYHKWISPSGFENGPTVIVSSISEASG